MTMTTTTTENKAEQIATRIRTSYPQFETTVEHLGEDECGTTVSAVSVRFRSGYRTGYLAGSVDLMTSKRFTGRTTTRTLWASYFGGKRQKTTRREFFWNLQSSARYEAFRIARKGGK